MSEKRDEIEWNDAARELFELIEREFGWLASSNVEKIVDCIVERFDVTSKPVITVEELGRMVGRAATNYPGDLDNVGGRMAHQLEKAGLTIVRVGEGQS